MAEKEVIIDVKVTNEKAMQSAVAMRVELERLKKEQTELNKKLKEGEITQEQYAKETLKNAQGQKQAKESVKAFMKEATTAKGSLEDMRGELKLLTDEYDKLSKAERDGAKGTELATRISDLTAQLNEAEQATGRFGRNVGNYMSAFDASSESLQRFGGILASVFGGKFGPLLQSLGNGMDNLNKTMAESQTAGAMAEKGATMAMGGFYGMAAAVKAAAKQFLAFMANPIVLTIAAIAAVVLKVASAFKENDNAMTALAQAFGAFRPVLDLVNRGFTLLADGVGKVVNGIAKFVNAIMSHIPALRDYAAANWEIIESQEALEDQMNEYKVAIAQNEAEISELRGKSVERDKYSVEQRKQFLEDAIALEEDNLKMNRKNAQDELEIARKEAMQKYKLRGEWDDLTKEQIAMMDQAVKDHLADLEVALINTSKEFQDGTRRMKSQLASFDKEEESAAKQRAATAANAAKARADAEKAAMRELEDAFVKSIADGEARALAEARVAGQRTIDDLRKRLKTESNLTAKAKKAISQRIVLEEAKLQLTLSDIRRKAEEASDARRIAAAKQYYGNLLSTLSEGEAKVAVQIEIGRLEASALKATLYQRADELKRLVEDTTAAIGDSDKEILERYGDAFTLYSIDTTKGAQNALRELNAKYRSDELAARAEADANAELIDRARAQRELKLKLESDRKLEDRQRRHADLMAEIESQGGLQLYWNNEVEKTRILEEQARRRLRISKNELQTVESYSEEEAVALYGSVEGWKNAIAEAELEVVKGQGEVAEATRATTAAIDAEKQKLHENAIKIGEAFNSIAGSLQALFTQMAESDEKYADFATAMALMQILVSTAISIASAIQGATTAGAATGIAAPLTTPAFIAEMIAIVLGSMVSATTTLMQAKQKKQSAPKFARGGWVDGYGGDTSDNIPAWLSPGEFVVNARAARRHPSLLEALNGGGGGYGNAYADGGWARPSSFDEMASAERTARMMADAMENVHPVVSVKEIARVNARVAVKERIGKNQ